MPIAHRSAAVAAAALALVGIAGCGSASSSSSGGSGGAADPGAAEVSPPGDIPDDQVFVRYAPAGAGFSVKVPEGWSRTRAAGAVVFTDKLNAVRLESAAAKAPLTVAEARRTELPKLAASVKGFKPGSVTTVSRSGGKAIRITYGATAAPDPVTGRTGRNAVERYVFLHAGREAILTLSGPKGADNVDPWRIVSDSVRWR